MDHYMNAAYEPHVMMNRIERLYPDIYGRLYPHARNVADAVRDEDIAALAEEDVGRMADEAVSRSNIMQDPPAGHTRDTIRDVAKTLMVQDLAHRFRRGRFHPFPFFPPFFFFPFDGRRFDRDRDRRWY